MLNSKAFLIMVGVAVSIIVLAFLRAPVITPLKPNANLPTFSQVQEQIDPRRAKSGSEPRGSEPWSGSERNAREVRKYAREGALKALDAVGPSSCTELGHNLLIGGLGNYAEQRGMQTRGYAASWGADGARFIAEAWGTNDDERVLQMMRDAYTKGYFKIDDFRSFSRETMSKLLEPAKPASSPC